MNSLYFVNADRYAPIFMRVQVFSDLHFEFGGVEHSFKDIDLLILAGDINIGEKGFEWIQQNVKNIPVIYVLGNHEYYKRSYPKLLYKLQERSKQTNINVLEKDSIVLGGIRFHGTTLWTDFELYGDPKIAGYACQQRMSDYKLIRIDPSYSKLRSIDTHIMHYKSRNWLKQSLLDSNEKTNVVITHHAPSIKSIPNKFKDDIISAAYASDLEDFILETKPNLWIHGHIHEPADYQIGETRILCNPHGYIDDSYNGHNPNLVVEISA